MIAYIIKVIKYTLFKAYCDDTGIIMSRNNMVCNL